MSHMRMSQIHITVTCHCSSAGQELATPNSVSSTAVTSSAPSPITLCHCTACRHVTGQLLTSYQPIAAAPDLTKVTAFSASPRDTRYFCTTCGCHIFRCTTDDPNQDAGDGTEEWTVATGTIVSDTAPSNDSASASGCLLGEFASHSHVQDTGKDGGLSTFLPNLEHAPTLSPHSAPPPQPLPPPSTLPPGTIPASCHCTLVTLYITPPTAASRSPKSPLADLIIPFNTGSPLIANAADDKWWLRTSPSSGKTKYLAGTCACASCRLISGFEIQSWAFIPRTNILIREHEQRGEPGSVVPLDFEKIPGSTLGVYESSPGMSRNF